ncbi:DUF488 family protein [Streptomyces sp. ODS28]|uniref:DUF488 domain-containing protein n=1 Tax=Streptomyces sp. ODS28 TaxID=3136688 RepID=UPI0031E724CF
MAEKSERKGGRAPKVRTKRVYEAPDPAADGVRVLVDKLWPRGLSKADARLDEWDKEVAPSDELRKWYRHDPEKYEEFAERYRAELSTEEGDLALRTLYARAGDGGTLTLLTATKDVGHSHVSVLVELLHEQGARDADS